MPYFSPDLFKIWMISPAFRVTVITFSQTDIVFISHKQKKPMFIDYSYPVLLFAFHIFSQARFICKLYCVIFTTFLCICDIVVPKKAASAKRVQQTDHGCFFFQLHRILGKHIDHSPYVYANHHRYKNSAHDTECSVFCEPSFVTYIQQYTYD